MRKDSLPNGEIGCQQPGLPFNMFLLQALQCQTQVTIYICLFLCECLTFLFSQLPGLDVTL